MKDIIKRLEQQRVAIERALSALREVDGTMASASAPATAAAPVKRTKRKGGMTAEGRKRLSEALRARWAAKRAGGTGSPVAAKKAAAKRGRKKSA